MPIWYGIGRFWIEELRTDSLCTNGIGGACAGALRMAQVVSLLLVIGGLLGLYLNHRRPSRPPETVVEATSKPVLAKGGRHAAPRPRGTRHSRGKKEAV